jgi:hypothetical protein
MSIDTLNWAVRLLDTLGYDLQHRGAVWVVFRAGRAVATLGDEGLIRFAQQRVDR